MTAEIADLLSISAYGGASVLLTQGAGGNTSVKSSSGAGMWIKASGYPLKEISEGRGYLKIFLPLLRQARASMAAEPDQSDNLFQEKTLAAVEAGVCLRPSLETLFHAYLGRLVLHTHAVYANAFGCMKGGSEILAGAISGLATIPYVTPGLALGEAVARICERAAPPETILLENHGLIASGRTPAETIARTRDVIRAGTDYFGPLPEPFMRRSEPSSEALAWCAALSSAYESAGLTAEVRPASFAVLADAAAEMEFFYGGGNLVPDDAIYNGGTVRLAAAGTEPGEWLAQRADDRPPRLVIALERCGVVLLGPNRKTLDSMEEGLLAHVLVRLLIARRGSPRPLTDAQSHCLLSLGSEKYRQAFLAERSQPDAGRHSNVG